MKRFPTGGNLSNWLTSKETDVSMWGHGEAKNVEDLWHEFDPADCAIQDELVLRVVNAARLIVRIGELQLIGIEHEFASGRRQPRNDPPAE